MILVAMRFLLVGLSFVIASLACLPLFLVRWRNPRNNAIYSRMLAWPIVRILGIRSQVIHPERLGEIRPCVFVANHQSNFDLIVFSLVFPTNTVVLAKRSLAYIPLFGWLLFLGGNLLVNRGDPKNTMGAMRDADEAISERGTSVWFFPEGTRSKGKGLGQLRKGAFMCAARNEVPLVVIVAASPRGGFDFTRLRAGELRLEVLPPAPTSRADLENIETVIERTRLAFEETSQRLAATVG
jgi:1-acyl-sn-glycerol-3-phosphate acyltransferase